jgi:hypothetical protein
MALLYTRDDALHDLNGDDAYRAYLIGRNAPPIVYHSGEMQWKRLRVLARRIRAAFAAMRFTVVADKARTLYRGRP